VLQLRREARGCLSYLLASGGHAIVVDPAPDPTPYLSLAASLGVEITQVVETHVHADHVSGARALVARTGAALRLSPAALARGLRDAGQPLGDGQPVPLPGSHVHALALPGHTSESMGLLVEGRALLGGDSLFADGVARPDLEAGGRGAEHAARRLHRTLHGRILPLGDAVQLLPAHYPGGRRAGPVAPTLGEVRARLDLLELDEDAFVARVLSSLPAAPENHERIVAVNLGLADADAGALEVGTNGCAVA
jgi:glyoxylase-like metal-dependent hydrolase (beta-lactamase superfamily II)